MEGFLIGIAAGTCFVLIFGIIGVVILVKYFRDKKKTDESQSWSSASGKITESYMRREASMESGSTIYYPEVQYDYEFLGTKYTGDRISFGGSSGNSNRKKSEETLAKYPIGQNVTIYYNPNNPEDAVLERKMGTGGTVFLIIGILFTFIALCTLCISGVIAVAALAGY